MVYTCNGILFSLKIEGNTVIYENMDRPGGYYTKWYKPIAEGQMLHDPIYIKHLK